MTPEATPDEKDAPGRLTASDAALLGILLSATFIAYSGTIGYDFVYDDRAQILENQYVKSWRYVPRYFAGNVGSFQSPYVLGNYYRPLFLLWLRANHALFGFVPWKWHLVNVLCHLLVTFLVYILIKKIVGDRVTSAIATAIFGLHPVHVEVVAWVSGVPEMLLALLSIPSFLCYARYREVEVRGHAGRNHWLAVSLSLYLLAILAKETAIVLLGIFLAYDRTYPSWSPGDASGRWGQVRSLMGRYAPFIGLTAIYLVVRSRAIGGLSHALTPLPLSTVLLTLPSLLVFDLGLLLWPVGLSAFYDVPYVTQARLLNFFLPTFALLAAGFLVWALGRRRQDFMNSATKEVQAGAFASVWLVLPILPVLNISVFFEGDFAHDRYLYLPSIGFSILVALALGRLNVGAVRVLGRSSIQLAAAVVLAALLALGTVYQNAYWADELVLYHQGHQVAPNNLVATVNLANVASRRGMYTAAVKLYESVMTRSPGLWLVNYNLAYTYYNMGNLEQAESYFTRAIAINPRDPDQYLWLGLTRFKMGHRDDAIVLIKRAILIRPDAYGYHFALGVVLESKENLRQALEEFKLELANDPEQNAAKEQIAQIEVRLRSSNSESSGIRGSSAATIRSK